MTRTIAFRRHQTERHMWRRLKEDWNEHYRRPNYLDRTYPGVWIWPSDGSVRFAEVRGEHVCPCFTDPKTMARFKEQPQTRTDTYYGNPRRDKSIHGGRWQLTPQELRNLDAWQFHPRVGLTEEADE